LGSAPGAGADAQHGIQAALERWVENSNAPAEIIAKKYIPAGREEDAVVRTRPICPYPSIARYKGSGSTDQAANYTCVSEPGN
jgi:feruloyl esterase